MLECKNENVGNVVVVDTPLGLLSSLISAEKYCAFIKVFKRDNVRHTKYQCIS